MTELIVPPAALQPSQPGVAKFLADPVRKLYIGGRWVEAASGKTFPVINPTTEQVIAHVAEADKADVDAAVQAARSAFEGPWGRMRVVERTELLRRLGALIAENADEIAELETVNNGSPISIARSFVGSTVDTIDYFAGSARLIHGETPSNDPKYLTYTLREPIGVCAGIVPWNVPFLFAIGKLAPALAAGNTFVLKPAEQTPLTAIRLGELVEEAGFPAGVVNIVTGFGLGAGSSIAEHPDIDKVSFTGSVEVGKKILAASAVNLKRVTLELGGKSPNIIFKDADLSVAVPTAVAGFTMSSGQICVAGTRLFVQREIMDEVTEKLTEYAGSLRIGDPLDSATDLGPLVSQEQLDRVTGYFGVGAADGARVALGGAAVEGAGYFVEPTVFVDVRNDMRIAREEIFGPVVSVIPFTDEDDAVLQGNDTLYGLAASVWTNDLGRAHRVARGIKAGSIWVNNYFTGDTALPFGGYKESGLGRENGLDWYKSFTEDKSVYVTL
ncbi:aldehyde dehydrogenase family protein [Gordonia terrae]